MAISNTSYIHVPRFGKTALHFALGNSDARNLSALAEAGAAVDARDDTGRAPLWCAVTEDGHRDHVQGLIHAGADVNARDQREKRTPLQVRERPHWFLFTV
jgi:ankyrin repeat protein